MSASSRPLDPRRIAALAALGLGQAAFYLALALRDDTARPLTALGLVLAAFILYAASLLVARGLDGRLAFALVALLAIAFRLALLPRAPFFSDDVFRYLWDGRVALAGINPYRYAPADPALAGIADALRARVNHPDVPTIYPPVAQLAFLTVAALGGGVLTLKTLWLLCDLGIAALLFRMCPAERRLQTWTIYAWSPLVVVEVAGNAHLDPLGALFLVLALYLDADRARPTEHGRPIAGLALAAAALVKYFPAALVPAAIRRSGRRRGRALLAAFAAAIVLLYLPYIGAGARLFAGLATYARLWRFNDGLFHVLAWLVPSAVAKAIGVAVVLGVVLGSVRNEWSLERTAFWVVGAILIFSPTVHPWYLLWMVPLLALRPNRAWVYLTGAVFLAYYGLATYRSEGTWPEPWPLKLLIWGPFFALLVADGWRGSWWASAWEVIKG